MSFIGDLLGEVTGSNKATKAATKAATQASDNTLALAKDIYGQTVQRIDPYSQSGVQAQGYYNALIGLPSSVSGDTARGGFQSYLDNFGFQSDLDSGSRAIVGNQAANHLLGSGSTLKALQRFGVGLRGQYAGNYLNLLGNQQAAGLNASTALAGAGSNYTGQVAQVNDSRASAIGNAALARAGMNTNFLSSAIGAAATLSDERTKDDIEKVGEFNDGLGIYKFRYKGTHNPQIGVMAQEVAKKRPDALGPKTSDGFMTVNYLKLAA